MGLRPQWTIWGAICGLQNTIPADRFPQTVDQSINALSEQPGFRVDCQAQQYNCATPQSEPIRSRPWDLATCLCQLFANQGTGSCRRPQLRVSTNSEIIEIIGNRVSDRFFLGSSLRQSWAFANIHHLTPGKLLEEGSVPRSSFCRESPFLPPQRSQQEPIDPKKNRSQEKPISRKTDSEKFAAQTFPLSPQLRFKRKLPQAKKSQAKGKPSLRKAWLEESLASRDPGPDNRLLAGYGGM